MTAFNEYQKQTIERLATELQTVIGKTCSDNHSPTLNSKLVSINKDKGTCIMEITPSEYYGVKPTRIGKTYEQSIQIVHNGYFY